MELRGPIYGDAPSLCDVEITPAGGSAAPIWASFSWWRRHGGWNRCWNGDFENDSLLSDVWSVASVANINSGAATSFTSVGSGKFGAKCGNIICPASSDRGASFRMFSRFKKGVTYTAEAWIRSVAATTNTYIRLGNAAANDKASSANVALSSTWQRISVTWTPTADYDDAHVAINIAAATSTNFYIDGVMVYAGTTAPTAVSQSEGRGGFPPLGILEAENLLDAPTALVASANYRSGFAASLDLAPHGILRIVIDPSLLVPDDQSDQEIAIEVWARVEIASTDTITALIVSAYPLSSDVGLPATYTDEFGSAGTTLVPPSSGTVRRFVRGGTLRLKTNARYFFGVEYLQPKLDYFVLFPANARALSPSAKKNDAKFPKFSPTTTEVTRLIRSDLTGTFNEVNQPVVPGPGLGGSLIELPVADVDFGVKLSSLVPNDPTSNTTTEQLAHSATVHFKITPRWRLGRSS
jgi:hypothetical protein